MPASRTPRTGASAPAVSAPGAVALAGRRSLWFAAVWTGVGAAAACATGAIVAVAILWLPVSGASGHTMSAIRAGLLTFVAAVHGGLTVDGTSAAFVPLGLTLAVALAAWRAGSALGEAADALDERRAGRLAAGAAVQAASFTTAVLVAIPFAHLGTSSAPFVGAGVASMLLFGVVGGTSFARSSRLGDHIAALVPAGAARLLSSAARAAAAGLVVYLCSGALLVAGSLAMHAGRVETLSRHVGTGWGGVPILALGLLAAPNAVIAGTSYLAGPGFAVGSGTTVNALSTTHGVLPAFPVLGALPQGHGASAAVWALIVVTPIAAGVAVVRVANRCDGWRERMVVVVLAGVLAAAAMSVLAWQGGGGIGDGRLRALGASPWQAGLAVGAFLVVAATAVAAAAAVGRAVVGRVVVGRVVVGRAAASMTSVDATLFGWRERAGDRPMLAAVVPSESAGGSVADDDPRPGTDAEQDGKLAG